MWRFDRPLALQADGLARDTSVQSWLTFAE
jgi:hypothetical protein